MRFPFRRTRTGRRRALSIHLRLFVGFGAALVACCALMVTGIYVGVRFLPTYDFATPLPRTRPMVPGHPYSSDPPVFTSPPGEGAKYGRTVEVSGLIRDKEDVWATVLYLSIGGLLLVTAIGLLCGWVFSRRLLAPLHTISQAAARAGEGDLTYRINAQGPGDELKRLADTFDTTLERLEVSFAAHQRFAANASHELLTPLATTRAALQLAGSDDSGESLRELLPLLTQSNERNIRIVKELLALAAADQVPHDTEPVDLSQLVREVSGESRTPGGPSIEVRAPENAECEVRGNPTLLRQMVSNIIGNAVTHNTGGPDAFVAVTLRRDGGDTVLFDVANSGPRIDPDTSDRLFEPFYRATPRVGSDRGHGLGLALVRSVARAHGGTATATARPTGGLDLQVRLPPAT
ncbi:sensor histidine kinase [Streptomyces sp. H34-S4]|uniref:sensor histidine kinase n=1 Tax=Streptomyces sp. H34-S4 TaxID=2996463 RepID=UPI00226DE0AA|nr:HAMP domain-containing sensor histidine kinase [Streptomyces sp. H34-S4]MCY0937263.1 HAMP domain-containing sensor histidine kinase [Streptomyces sp. H34-S4]